MLERLKIDFTEGRYAKIIEEINRVPFMQRDIQLDNLYMSSCLRGNYMDKALLYATGLYQKMIYAKDQQTFEMYLGLIKSQNVVAASLRIIREAEDLNGVSFYTKEFKDELRKDYRGATVFPICWPIAYGDMIVTHQFIKYFKQENPNKKIVVIMPLNRPELVELAELNTSIDRVIDITTMKEQERDRGISLFLENKGFLNLTIQECMIEELINCIEPNDTLKLRYLPVLLKTPYVAGFRIWEERARLWLDEKKELPKLVENKRKKKDKIVIHFRQGGYNDAKARDININYAQDMVNKLKEVYPQYEIVKIGDSSMYSLDKCTNAHAKNLTLKEQIKEIQEAKLFIGSHSAPQHLVVACSDTPIICFNYVVQETTRELSDNIAKLSYEPLGTQVKAIFHSELFDAQNNKLLPLHNHPHCVRYEHTDMNLVIAKAKEVLG